MSVTKFEPPADAFALPIEVKPAHIDGLGHVGNQVWVQWVNDLATSHSEQLGLDLAYYRDLGALWVVRRHDISYLAEAFAGDELLGRTWISSARGARSMRRSTIHRTADGSLCCRAETEWAFIDISRRRPRRIPHELMRAYGYSPD